MPKLLIERESKIFDPRDPSTASYGSELLDASVTNRDDGWWMVLAGQPTGHGATDLFSASLPLGETLAAKDGNLFATVLESWCHWQAERGVVHGTATEDGTALLT